MFDTSIYDNIFSLISATQNNNNENKVIIDILEFTSAMANADGCLFYKISPSKYINLEYIKIKSLRLNIIGASCDKIRSSIYIPDIKNKNLKTPLEVCASSHEVINSPDIHNEPLFDTSYLKKFDLDYDYTSVSLLIFPLFDSSGNIISIVQFLNAKAPSGKIVTFSQDIQEKIISVCQLISVLLERQQQNNIHNKFLESFLSSLTKIELSKTPHIAKLNNHVPLIAQRLAVSMLTSSDKSFKNFEMSDIEWNMLNIVSLIYDYGKMITPDYVLNKSTKLETVYNRIHEIRQRFEILRRDAHIEYLQKRLNNVADKETLQAEFVEKVKKLHDDFEFIGMCNTGNFDLKKEDATRLDNIASQTFTRYFDRTIGLSVIERDNTENNLLSETAVETLLQNRPEQASNPYDRGELSNLKTKRGALNPTERKKIQENSLNTSNILSDINFPKEYSDILEIINTHEKILKGYPIPPNDNSKTTAIAKIISLSTIFAELITEETPCAKTKKLSEVMKTMQKMKNKGIIDADLYDLFIKNDIYMDYAKEYLDVSQIDKINIEEII